MHQKEVYYGSFLWYIQLCPSRCPQCCCTGTLQLCHGLPDSCIQVEKKLSKPVVRISKEWNGEAVEDLPTFLDCTDWEYVEPVRSNISFCGDCSELSWNQILVRSYTQTANDGKGRNIQEWRFGHVLREEIQVKQGHERGFYLQTLSQPFNYTLAPGERPDWVLLSIWTW